MDGVVEGVVDGVVVDVVSCVLYGVVSCAMVATETVWWALWWRVRSAV